MRTATCARCWGSGAHRSAQNMQPRCAQPACVGLVLGVGAVSVVSGAASAAAAKGKCHWVPLVMQPTAETVSDAAHLPAAGDNRFNTKTEVTERSQHLRLAQPAVLQRTSFLSLTPGSPTLTATKARALTSCALPTLHPAAPSTAQKKRRRSGRPRESGVCVWLCLQACAVLRKATAVSSPASWFMPCAAMPACPGAAKR